MDKKLNKFLDELTELTKKYGYIIGACGCCGSPFLYEVKDYENRKYTINKKGLDTLSYEKTNEN